LTRYFNWFFIKF